MGVLSDSPCFPVFHVAMRGLSAQDQEQAEPGQIYSGVLRTMSDSNRGDDTKVRLIGTSLVALVGVAMYWAMFYGMGFASGQHQRRAYVEREHHASDTPKQIEGKCGSKTGADFRECVAEIVQAERESQRSESDLAAQWKAADWVMWAGVLAGAQLIATAVGLFYIRETLRATLEAVKDTGEATRAMVDANEIARAGQRPWLHFEKVDVYQNAKSVVVRVTVRNTGVGPAVNLIGFARVEADRVDASGKKSLLDAGTYLKSVLPRAANVAPGGAITLDIRESCPSPTGQVLFLMLSVAYFDLLRGVERQTAEFYWFAKRLSGERAEYFTHQELNNIPEGGGGEPVGLKCELQAHGEGRMT